MEEDIKSRWTFDAEYISKEEGCGELILNLFIFFKTIKPGMQVCVTTYSPGASDDIEIWCRSTNKLLVESHPPYFLIEKR